MIPNDTLLGIAMNAGGAACSKAAAWVRGAPIIGCAQVERVDTLQVVPGEKTKRGTLSMSIQVRG